MAGHIMQSLAHLGSHNHPALQDEYSMPPHVNILSSPLSKMSLYKLERRGEVPPGCNPPLWLQLGVACKYVPEIFPLLTIMGLLGFWFYFPFSCYRLQPLQQKPLNHREKYLVWWVLKKAQGDSFKISNNPCCSMPAVQPSLLPQQAERFTLPPANLLMSVLLSCLAA